MPSEVKAQNTIDLSSIKRVSDKVEKTDQYFWHTETGEDAGAHITQVPKEDFIANPEGGNTLIDTDGLKIRSGLIPLAEFSRGGVAFTTENDVEVFKLELDGTALGPSSDKVFFRASVDGTKEGAIETKGNAIGNFNIRVSVYSGDIVGKEITYLGNQTTAETITFSSAELDGPTVQFTIEQTDINEHFFNYSCQYSNLGQGGIGVDIKISYEILDDATRLHYGSRHSSYNDNGSVSFGKELDVSQPYSAHFGQYNNDESGLVFSVGVGDSNSYRRNAIAVIDDNYDPPFVKLITTRTNSLTATLYFKSPFITDDENDRCVAIGYGMMKDWYSGRTGSVATPANSYKDVTVSLPTYTQGGRGEPKVLCQIFSTSTAGAIGNLSVSFLGFTRDGNDNITGLTFRVFNAGSAQRSPAVDYLVFWAGNSQ